MDLRENVSLSSKLRYALLLSNVLFKMLCADITKQNSIASEFKISDLVHASCEYLEYCLSRNYEENTRSQHAFTQVDAFVHENTPCGEFWKYVGLGRVCSS